MYLKIIPSVQRKSVWVFRLAANVSGHGVRARRSLQDLSIRTTASSDINWSEAEINEVKPLVGNEVDILGYLLFGIFSILIFS